MYDKNNNKNPFLTIQFRHNRDVNFCSVSGLPRDRSLVYSRRTTATNMYQRNLFHTSSRITEETSNILKILYESD
jgi:hypothetical protein